MINSVKKDKTGEAGRINIYMIVYMFIWVLLLIFIGWRARMGAASYDESLYLSIPYRLYQGDAMIRDEWNLSQLSSLATIPFIYFYTHICHGTDGITLAYRYWSVLVWALVSLLLYIKLGRYLESKKLPRIFAIVSSAVIMVYAPFGMMVLSYNTYALIALILAGLILLPCDDKAFEGPFRWMAAGFVYAYSVLCSPHVLLLWIAGLIYALYKKKIRPFLYFTLGAGCLALVLGIFIISRASVAEVLRAIPVMLSDPYHQQVSVLGYVKDYFFQILAGIPHGHWIYLCFTLLFAAVFIDKGHSKRKGLYYIIGCVFTVLLLIFAFAFRRYINCFIFPLNILALLCFFLDRDELNRPLFMCFWLPGMIYSFCINMSSNQYYLAISSASLVALVGSIVIIGLFVYKLYKEEVRQGVCCMASYSLTLVILFVFILILRYSFVFIDSNISLQTDMITHGPQKGIMASTKDKNDYERVYEAAGIMSEYKPDRVLFFARDNWPYMLDSYRCGTYSPWLQNEIDDYAVGMLMAYYSMDESKKPDVIYIDGNYMEYAHKLLEYLDYRIDKELPSGDAIAVPSGT